MTRITAKALADPIERAGRRVLSHEMLCERAGRLERLVRWVAEFEENRQFACSRLALRAAVWFVDAWCAEDVRAGRFDALLVFAQPSTEMQRERSADIAFHALDTVLDDVTRKTAVAAIRGCGRRDTGLLEAQIVAEACNLESVGPVWLWGQIAKYAGQGRTIDSVIEIWKRQTEYRYWPKFIDEILRFPASRKLARQRSAALDAYFAALEDQIRAPEGGLPGVPSP